MAGTWFVPIAGAPDEAGSDRWLVKNALDAALWAETVRREAVRVGASKGHHQLTIDSISPCSPFPSRTL